MSPFQDQPIGLPTEYVEFAQLFNKGMYYEAHEVLEDLWIMERGPQRDFYQALIMEAAVLLHWQRGRARPALRLHARARGILKRYPLRYEGLALGEFLTAMNALTGRLENDPAAAFPNRDALPVLFLEEA